MMESEYFQPQIEEVNPHPAGGISAVVDPTIIAARFVDVPVVAIDDCYLEQEYFDAGCDRALFRIGDQQFSPEHLLKRVTAVIKLRSPVMIDPRCLIVRLNRSLTLASREITLRIGLIDTLGTISSHKAGDQYLDVLHPYLANPVDSLPAYTIRIPVIHDQLIQPPQMPLVDRILTKDHHVLHYTINIPSRIWPGGRLTNQFRVRIKVIQTAGFAQVVSISDNLVDMPRLQEAWGNFKDWVGTCCSRSTEANRGSAAPQPLKEVSLDESPDQAYYEKTMSPAGSPQTYSMPPPPVSMTGQNYFPYFPTNPSDEAQLLAPQKVDPFSNFQ